MTLDYRVKKSDRKNGDSIGVTIDICRSITRWHITFILSHTIWIYWFHSMGNKKNTLQTFQFIFGVMQSNYNKGICFITIRTLASHRRFFIHYKLVWSHKEPIAGDNLRIPSAVICYAFNSSEIELLLLFEKKNGH